MQGGGGAQSARVTSVVRKEKTKPRPTGLNTVELMRIASSGLGMGPAYASHIKMKEKERKRYKETGEKENMKKKKSARFFPIFHLL